MDDDDDFGQLIRRLRAGEGDAVAELLRRYEPTIRRMLQARLRRSPAAGGPASSADLCQSVFLSVCLRLAAGQYEVRGSGQLEALLRDVARKKLISQARKQLARRRDRRREEPAEAAAAFVDPQPTPAQQVLLRELLGEVERRLAPEELRLMELRRQGLSWDAIAAQTGGTAAALRQRMSRALDRLARELGFEPDE